VPGPLEDGNPVGTRSKRSLSEELASLRIERKEPPRREASPRREAAPRPDAYRPARTRRGRGRGLFASSLWLIPLALLGGLAYVVYARYSDQIRDQLQPRPEVSVALVQKMTAGEAEKLLTAKGYLQSHFQALVGAKVPGRVERLLIEEGKKVKQGDLLAVLEHADLDATLETRKAMIQRSEAELREARSDLAEKERKFRRANQLYLQRTTSKEEVEQASTAQEMASSHAAALEAAVTFARAQVLEAQRSIENMKVFAPFAGTILRKEAEAGETVSTMSMGGSNTRSAIANLADLEHMEVETDVSENLLSRLTIGQPAEVLVSAVPEMRYHGRVQRIIPMGDRTRGTVKVMVEVLDPDDRLFPELVATVNFLPAKKTQEPEVRGPSLFVSKDALIEEGGKTYAWVVDPKQTVHKKRVEVTQTTEELARIASGLEAGEAVVLKPAADLREGLLIQVAQ
jgi:RND family efflux transporter MFP subunit